MTLCLEGTAEPLASARTDAEGAFSFGELKPGSYKLVCDLPDSRYNFARPADAALHPGDADVPVGFYDYFTVAMGAQMTACDIGIGAMGELGDTAWLDLNGNGLQDGGEPLLPGVGIQLYQYGELAAVAVTDDQGRYRVTGLYPGAYTVRAIYPEEVMLMAEAYGEPNLPNLYCANECPLGKNYIPEIEVKELPIITLETLNLLNRLGTVIVLLVAAGVVIRLVVFRLGIYGLLVCILLLICGRLIIILNRLGRILFVDHLLRIVEVNLCREIVNRLDVASVKLNQLRSEIDGVCLKLEIILFFKCGHLIGFH